MTATCPAGRRAARRAPLLALVMSVLAPAVVAGEPAPMAEAPSPIPRAKVADPALRILRIEHELKGSMFTMQLDSAGRLFLGGTESLWVYEPGAAGGYEPRRELFRFPRQSVVYGIAIRGDDLYVSTINAIYLLPGARLRRDGVTAKRLIWGVPRTTPHQVIHDVVIGPEGLLYFCVGDPVWMAGDWKRPDHFAHYTIFTQPEGTRVPYTGVGAFFRCRPDGSGLEHVAGGTRNSVNMAFDSDWNLFSHDNDHENLPRLFLPGRLLHVTPHVTFSWPRGWLRPQWPDRADLLETMSNDIGPFVPAGQRWYDDEFLPGLRGTQLVARWRKRTVAAYAIAPRGASFSAKESTLLTSEQRFRPIGVAVGRGGRVFVTSVSMRGNQEMPDGEGELLVVTRADDPDAMPFTGYEAPSAMPERLWSELSAPSWSRRYDAHVELMRRGELGDAPRRLAAAGPQDPALAHLLWLAAAAGGPEAAAAIRRHATGPDARRRAQAMRVLAQHRALATPELFAAALADPEPAVQLAALPAFFAADLALPPTVVDVACSEDTYLRQTAALLLAERASMAELQAMISSDAPAKRLAGTLAAGFRLTLPRPFAPLDPRAVTAKVSPGAGKLLMVDGTEDLHQHGLVGSFTIAQWWSNVVPHEPAHEELFALLMRAHADPERSVRMQARFFLGLLRDERSEAAIDAAPAETGGATQKR